MDSAKDISKKIRSAIKAKLVELGAYVDDELPDYIMVMVANKKTQNQMTDDLSLFLGLNTEKFTSWLHGLLVKLQTLSSEQQKGKEKQIEESRDEEELETTGKKSSPDKPENLNMKLPSEKNVGKKTAVKRKSSEGKAKMGIKESGSKTVDSELLENESSSKPAPTSKLRDEEYVSELLESVETDEFSEEFIKEQEPRPVGTKAVKAVAPTTAINVQKHPTLTGLVVPQMTGSKVMIPTRDLSYPQQPKKKVVSKKVKTVIKRKADSGTARSGVPGSAKKKPSSIVGTVKQQFTELPDEEYDPLNPSFGKVASSVKVSRRRRLTIPPALQANKALILKATAEAEKSVSSTLQNVLKEEKLYSARGKALVRPVQRKVPELPELRHPKIRPNLELISKSKREEMMRNMTYTIANEESPESPESDEPENMKIVIQNKLKTGKVLQNANQEKVTYTVVTQPRKSQQEELVYSVDKRPSTRMQYISQAEPVQYAIRQMPQRVQVVSSVPSGYVATSQPQNVQYLTQLPSGQMAYTDTTEPQFIQYVKVERQQMEMEPVQPSFQSDNRRIQHVARVQPVMDSRLVKRKSFDEEIKDEIDKDEEEETSDDEEEEAEMLPDVDDTDETSNEGQMVAGSSDAEGQEVIQDEVKEEEEEEVEDVDSLSLEGEEKTPEPSPEPVIEEQKPVPSKRLIRERQPKQSKPKPAQINPRFIVTLDGIDPSTFRTGSMFDEDTPKREIPVVSKITPPSITPIKFDLRDTDDEEGEEDLETNEESPSKKSKMTEKCKFWPACSAGSSCSYHHPSVSCKMFPNCKFADKCLYIHPNCKFDAKCTKKDCPFTHASKRGTAPTVIKQYIPMPVHTPPPYNNKPQGKIVCRFGVTCQNVYCPFQHPTNCRYGANCANIASCPFTHPTATQFTHSAATQFRHPAATQFTHPAANQSKDKYSWTANKNLDNNARKADFRTTKTSTTTTVIKPS